MERDTYDNQKRRQTLWSHIIYFFPIQLLVLHIKKNHLLIIFWFLLFGYVSGNLASKYGVSYLFLYPEYLGQVDFWSHFLIGFALGGFVTAFNIYTYVIHAFRFRFLATLSRPFYKFSINNFLLPGIFIGFYIWKVIEFQRKIEFESSGDILTHVLGFFGGFFLFMAISLLYFYGTNKDVLGFLKNPEKEKRRGRFAEIYERFARERVKESRKRWNQRPWRVESYVRNFWSLAWARESEHYDEETLRRVFKQNHFNASLFEVLLVITFLIVMNFSELPIFTLPGGASVILMFTLLLMILSVLLSLFRGWAITVLILLIIGANHFSQDLSFLPKTNTLYGLGQSETKAPYNSDVLQAMAEDDEQIRKDRQAMEAVLDAWKEDQPGADKPKLLIINCSGGGLRSALWTTTILNELDSLLNGQLMNHAALMTGASGGMIGASYMRDKFIANDYHDTYSMAEQMKEEIGGDILNPILVSFASSDVFFQLGRFEYGDMVYPKDRAYRFEKQILENTGGMLDRPLGAYRSLESEARVPMLMLYPTIINDGRKMLVSPLDVGFMTRLGHNKEQVLEHQHELVEFRRLLGEQITDSTRFLSLVRASATFPYILPQVTLPTEPPIQLMDAGIRDNFGFSITNRFLYAMRSWVQANTGGVIVVQVRDKRKDIRDAPIGNQSILSRLTSPLGNVYGNFMKAQDFNNDELYASLESWLQVPLYYEDLQMEQTGADNVSMSWHLTALEKRTIDASANNVENKAALKRIVALLNDGVHN